MTSDAAAPMVSVERDERIAIVAIDRPAVNALSTALCDELTETFAGLADDPPGAVVVMGRGRMFSAGADIEEFGDEARRAPLAAASGRAFDAIAAFPRATIAAIHGGAYGGGLELALACDLRVVADNARLGLPEVLLGIFPGAGGTQRLPRLVGAGRAKDLILTGRTITGTDALAMGMVDRAVAPDDLAPCALGLARELGAGAVRAQSLAKEAIDFGVNSSLREGLAVERECFLAALETNDARRGIESFLANGPGKATFEGD